MKLFKMTVAQPFFYNLGRPNESGRYDIAWPKFKEVMVVSDSKEEAEEKIRAMLPPENPEIKNILLQSGVKSEYYTIEAKELQGKDGVYLW